MLMTFLNQPADKYMQGSDSSFDSSNLHPGYSIWPIPGLANLLVFRSGQSITGWIN